MQREIAAINQEINSVIKMMKNAHTEKNDDTCISFLDPKIFLMDFNWL